MLRFCVLAGLRLIQEELVNRIKETPTLSTLPSLDDKGTRTALYDFVQDLLSLRHSNIDQQSSTLEKAVAQNLYVMSFPSSLSS